VIFFISVSTPDSCSSNDPEEPEVFAGYSNKPEGQSSTGYARGYLRKNFMIESLPKGYNVKREGLIACW